MQIKEIMGMCSAYLATSVLTWENQRDGTTPTYIACQENHIDVLRIFGLFGANGNAHWNCGRHILCVSVHRLNMCKRDCTDLKNPTTVQQMSTVAWKMSTQRNISRARLSEIIHARMLAIFTESKFSTFRCQLKTMYNTFEVEKLITLIAELCAVPTAQTRTTPIHVKSFFPSITIILETNCEQR